jgi:hypothetical protein
MRARARLQLREQMADVRLDGLLGEKQPLPDRAVDQPVRDQLRHLDLTAARVPPKCLRCRLVRNFHSRHVGVAATRGHLFETTGVVEVAIEDLLLFRTSTSRVSADTEYPLRRRPRVLAVPQRALTLLASVTKGAGTLCGVAVGPARIRTPYR